MLQLTKICTCFCSVLMVAVSVAKAQSTEEIIPFVIQTGTTAAVHLPDNNIPNTITNLSGVVKFKAENEVILQKDFVVSVGSDFHAYLVSPRSYAELKDKLDASYFCTADNILYFKYDEKYAKGYLTFAIYNYKRQLILSGNSAGSVLANTVIQVPKELGMNFFSIPLKPTLGIPNLVATNDKDSFYTLEVLSDKGDKKLLRFKYSAVK